MLSQKHLLVFDVCLCTIVGRCWVCVEYRPAVPVQPMGDQTATCLSIPFGANGKKRKSVTSENSQHMDIDHTVIHNLDTSVEPSENSLDLSKRRRPGDNSANNGLFGFLSLII